MAKRLSQVEIRNDRQKKIADDIYKTNKMMNMAKVDKYDQKLFNQGIDWYNSGLEIDDAPEDIRNNTNFVRGFEKGKRVAEANNYMYEEGKNFFFNGGVLEQATDKMRSNPYFIKGYQGAMNFKNLLTNNKR